MKLIGNFSQGKPASLEEGPVKCHSINEYHVLHRDESRTNCGGFVQIVKVILCIELIILIGLLGYVSFSYYNTDRNTSCVESAIGCKSSEIDYYDIDAKNSRGSRSVDDVIDEQEKCERIANAMRRRLDHFAAQLVIGESSNTTVVQLRRKFTLFMIRDYLRTVIGYAIGEAFAAALVALLLPGNTVFNTTTTNPFSTLTNDTWQKMMEQLSEEFVNSTDAETRRWLEARGPPTGEMTSEFRSITESFSTPKHNCNMSSLGSLFSVRNFNESDLQALLLWNGGSGFMSQMTWIGCGDAEAQLLEDRRDRLEAIAAKMASDHKPRMSTIIFLNSIESALIATNPSEVTVEDHLLQNNSWLIPWKRFMSNASLELKKEFYELVRDVFLELRNENNVSSSWGGYDLNKAHRNWTDGLSILTESKGPEAVLNTTIKFGKAFNLHYVEAEREVDGIFSEVPTFGTFTYLDAEPEKLGVRRLRHILNGFVRLYFRVINRLGPCKSIAGHRLGITVL